MIQRIITRPDFDGVVCAVLLREALKAELPICWSQPNEMQSGRVEVGPEDIIANLPLHGQCALWFDHHVSNETQLPFKGRYRIAPSAARLIYEYYAAELAPRFDTLVGQTDKIDDAQLNLDEINHPERYPYILASMTIPGEPSQQGPFCNHLVELLQTSRIEQVLADPVVKQRCDQVAIENKSYETQLRLHTRLADAVSITDFRHLNPVPNGNRFLVYSLFPEAVVNMRIFNENEKVAVKIGHSIVNRNCRVNIGCLLADYGGGGHKGAGACRLDPENADRIIADILQILIDNRAA